MKPQASSRPGASVIGEHDGQNSPTSASLERPAALATLERADALGPRFHSVAEPPLLRVGSSEEHSSGQVRSQSPRSVSAVQLVQEGWAPEDTGADGVVVHTARPVNTRLRNRIAAVYPDRSVTFVSESMRAVQDRILVDRSDELADYIAEDFSLRHPAFAAKAGIARWQRIVAAGVVLAGAAAVISAPQLLWFALTLCTALVTLTMVGISAVGLYARRRSGTGPNIGVDGGPRPLSDAELPTYTVLVPAYHEEAVIGDLVRTLQRMDYPSDKLEVLILVERRDHATKQAIRDADPAAHIRIVELPPGAPQTKPRSCNAGLLLAQGELLVIYDAEDRPDPGQLRAAAAMFAQGGTDLACVQAKLLVHNADRNFITSQFALEYAMRYELTVPGLARLGLPIPLGGTSNHFRTATLRALGGWDAWNVTEDADLGMRCQAMGYRVDVVDSVTWGESTHTFQAWLGQRTRWLKGFMLTALVHSRTPRQTTRRFRPSGLVTLLVVVAGTPLHYAAQSIALAIWLTDVLRPGGPSLPHEFGVGTGLLFAGLIGTLMLEMVAARRSAGTRATAVLAPMLPVYWVMQWIATWRASVQLIRRPFQWEKTTHGAAATAPGGIGLTVHPGHPVGSIG